jgi:lysophospholipase L1-like esterase
LFCLASAARAETEILTDPDFSKDGAGWNGVGADDKKSITIQTTDGKKSLKLARIAEGAGVAVDQSVKLNPQTLYRFAVTGSGTGKAAIRLKPGSSTDSEFGKLYKAWATGSAPMPASEKPIKSELVFDSGLKADQASISVYLDGKEPGDYTFHSISLTEIGSSKPADEKIVLHLGDSITISRYLPFEHRIDALLRDGLKKNKPDAKVRHINYAADGETVKDLLASKRYQKLVKDNLARVDVVIIRYGANDSRAGKPEDFKTQLNALCDQLKADYPDVKILLGTGPHVSTSPGVDKQYGAYWQTGRDVAKERNLPLIDIFEAFQKAKSDKLTRGPQDMHPSAEGVSLMAETTYKVLELLLR